MGAPIRFSRSSSNRPSVNAPKPGSLFDSYLGVVAATNFKQRTRKMMEYYYADLFHYAVAGTPNRLEYDQGFFVKNGDGAADLKPIAHLYKTQVYQLAAYLGIPQEIQKRPSTTDTYPLDQSQEEFYFPVSYDRMDSVPLCQEPWSRPGRSRARNRDDRRTSGSRLPRDRSNAQRHPLPPSPSGAR